MQEEEKGGRMETLKEVKTAVSHLPQRKLAAFRKWFEEFEAASWDRQFEADVRSGKLDRMADKARSDYRSGRCTPL